MTTPKTKKGAKRGKGLAENPIDLLRLKQMKLKKLRVKMSRMLSGQARLQTKIKALHKAHRCTRVRTFIQVAGLVKISGLLEICQISEGDDLQLDLEAYDKAALLLGILLDVSDSISNPVDAGQMEEWRESGTRLLKQRAAQLTYQKRR